MPEVRAYSYKENKYSTSFINQMKEKYTFGNHLGNHLEHGEMLNDVRMVSLGILRGKCLGYKNQPRKKL